MGRRWPAGARLRPAAARGGDRRNVVDRYRYWSLDAIVADLDTRRHGFHVAIENWQHDLNIGTVVRNANAFLAAEVHIVGRRRWNRRGAMVTDRYQHVRHHRRRGPRRLGRGGRTCRSSASTTCRRACRWRRSRCPRRCVLLFGQEGPGLSEPPHGMRRASCSIAQYGSTRSINAGVASGNRDARLDPAHGDTLIGPLPWVHGRSQSAVPVVAAGAAAGPHALRMEGATPGRRSAAAARGAAHRAGRSSSRRRRGCSPPRIALATGGRCRCGARGRCRSGWTVTGVGWVGDERSGVRATADRVQRPGPGRARPGGLRDRRRGARQSGRDPVRRHPWHRPRPVLRQRHRHDDRARQGPGGRLADPAVDGQVAADRCAYVGEAMGMWLYVVTWPAAAGYLLEEGLDLHDSPRMCQTDPSTARRRHIFTARRRRIRLGSAFGSMGSMSAWCTITVCRGTDTLSSPRRCVRRRGEGIDGMVKKSLPGEHCAPHFLRGLSAESAARFSSPSAAASWTLPPASGTSSPVWSPELHGGQRAYGHGWV